MTTATARRDARDATAKWSVLCIDDDPVAQILLSEVVRTAGASYAAATSAREAERMLQRGSYDLILLDRRLPDGDGLLLLQTAREQIGCPVMVLSELSDARERQLGIGLGASEYLAKPINPVELSSRIRYALVGRDHARAAARAQPIRLGRLELIPSSRQLTIDGASVFLPPAEARLLEAFMETPEEVLSRDRLTRKTCGRDWSHGDRTVDVLIARLRRRLPAGAARIVTVHGTGYLLSVRP